MNKQEEKLLKRAIVKRAKRLGISPQAFEKRLVKFMKDFEKLPAEKQEEILKKWRNEEVKA